MAKAPRDALTTDKQRRLFTFLYTGKAPDVCSRFVSTLDTLVPQKLSHIPRIDDELKKDLIFAATPQKVRERYVEPAMRDATLNTHRSEEIKRIAWLYCRYLVSDLADRIWFINHERKV
jgi:hypothetical protein